MPPRDTRSAVSGGRQEEGSSSMDALYDWLARLRGAIDLTLFEVGSTTVTVFTAIYVIVVIVLLFWVSRRLQTWVSEGLLGKSGLDPGGRQTAGGVVRYAVLLVGLCVRVQSAGSTLSPFNVLAGAVGIGAGFGLQAIVSNLFAGLIIMVQRPIKLYDRIEVDGVAGDVIEIGARATVVRTNDNITIIVPNSKFITDNVVNWSYDERKVRFKIPVSVAYGSDVRLVERLLLEVARKEPGVLDTPEPGVRFIAFGDSGLQFELRAWTSSLIQRSGLLISSLNFAIYDAFNEHGIGFPFPQRDLHIKSGVLETRPAAPPTATERD
jgi:small-conductance mechanosensitive channel